ncbi:hypothetical protein DXV75_09420 [Alteromonas aestuariivivens]|uniref:DUF3122 domain-containing protein n=1 Tax=Alteromonas aestuariivivens TaxID=1938339 RepID=A0A3D8M711_9ALTE|nr:hypothetical protein [Alteromonas aestuariivivens]RDV25508.1 hypothetical protein DXV75_09420 [Alteromonas aestuariivivens]
MRLFSRVFIFILACLSFTSQAITFSLSERDVNQMVRLAFPQSQAYQGLSWTFSEPELQLGELRNLTISLTLSATQEGRELKARGTFSGELAYQPGTKQLQIAQPMLVDYRIEQNQLAPGESWVSLLEDWKGQPLPMILLVDFNHINLGLLGNQLPKRIDIQKQKLIIEI